MEEEEKKDLFGEEENHESYGMVGISRVSGGHKNLFGSSIKHTERILLTVRRASKRRNLNHDSFYGREEIVEVEMSPVQFSEMLFSMNYGSGVPCTIRHVQRKMMEPCPEVQVREKYEAEFDEDVRRVTQRLVKIERQVREKLKAKGTLKRAEREELASEIMMLVQHVRANLPFIASQFNETMDGIVNAAKGEADAWLARTITDAGLEHLGAEKLAGSVPKRRLLKRGKVDGKAS